MTDTATITDTKLVLKTPSQWKVLLLNDDYTPMDFVVAILVEVFRKTEEEATQVMWQVHQQGRAVAGLYTKEVALTKVAIVRRYADAHEHPLLAVAEAE